MIITKKPDLFYEPSNSCKVWIRNIYVIHSMIVQHTKKSIWEALCFLLKYLPYCDALMYWDRGGKIDWNGDNSCSWDWYWDWGWDWDWDRVWHFQLEASPAIKQIHKFHNARFPNPTMHNSEQKCAHFCSELCNVGYGTGALWDLSIDLITQWTRASKHCITQT